MEMGAERAGGTGGRRDTREKLGCHGERRGELEGERLGVRREQRELGTTARELGYAAGGVPGKNGAMGGEDLGVWELESESDARRREEQTARRR
jgi:hypothetical protein